MIVTLGPSGIDHYYEAESWPALGEKAMLSNHEVHCGGMTANSACVLAALGLPVTHIERMNTQAAPTLLASLHSYGVNTDLVQMSPNAHSATCWVVRVEGERTILIDAEGREAIAITPSVREALNSAKMIVTGVHELREAALQDAVHAAVDRGVQLVLDIEVAGLGNSVIDTSNVRKASFVFASHLALARLGVTAAELAREGREVVVMSGATGSHVYFPGGDKRVPPLPVEVVDTTGCSDTYLAAYMTARLDGDQPIVAARFATAAAARAATGLGPRFGAVDRDTISRFAAKVGR